MEVMSAILERRSCRAYKPDPVPEEVLAEILKAGTYAPTAMGKQSPIILCVTNKDLRDRLSRLNASFTGNPDGDPFYGAPAVMVVLADRTIAPHVYDGSLVMGHLMLAAWDKGLGSCWMSAPQRMGFGPALQERFAPGKGEFVSAVTLGYPEVVPQMPPRRDGRYIIL